MSRMKKKVSINDIAKKLDLSPTTISNAINRPDKVKPVTRERILTTMRELGYEKDVYASINSRMRKGIKTAPLVAISIDLEAEKGAGTFPLYTSHVLFALLRQLKRKNCRSTIIDIENAQEQYTDDVLSCDGIVFIPEHSSRAFEFVEGFGKKNIVTVARSRLGTTGVRCDNDKAGQMAADYFYRMGHRNVAVIANRKRIQTDQYLRSESFIRHFNAYEKGHADVIDYAYERSIERAYIKEPGDIQSAEACFIPHIVDYIREAEHPPTALFIPIGALVLAVYEALEALRLVVGKDIGILGFDDFSYFTFMKPKVTTICYDFIQMGAKAAEIIATMFEDDAYQHADITLPPVLIERTSVLAVDEMNAGYTPCYDDYTPENYIDMEHAS